MATDPRFLTESGREIFTGNELLVKGALETEGGVHLLTGYPGSPVSGFFDILGDIKDVLQSHGIRAFQANNEALGAAAVNGSQMAPCRAIAVMKSVGVHVASDALALGNLAGAHSQGGAVIIMGDDPWCDSTQVPADSRFLCEHLRMVVVEPGDMQELKDWIDLSFKLSQAAGLYVGYIVTTALADGGGTVMCRANQFPTINTNQKVALDTQQVNLDRVLLPPRTWQRELEVPARQAKTLAAARELGLNRIIPAAWDADAETRGHGDAERKDAETRRRGDAEKNAEEWHESSSSPLPASPRLRVPALSSPAPLGFIVTGSGGSYLRHVLSDLGLAGVFPILQMGVSYPADVKLVAEFSKLCDRMIVIEERRSFLEKNIRDSLFHEFPADEASRISERLFGKSFPGNLQAIPSTRGLNPSVLAQILIPLIKAAEQLPPEMRNGKLTAELDRIRAASKPKLAVISEQIIGRSPTFCPGCPHRDSSAALLQIRKDLADPKYMLEKHGAAPVDLVAHGDTGCYTMLMFAPTEQLMHNYSGMGLGGGTGTGIDPFITNKQIVFMGDGTFFHSGQVAISNSIKTAQDITYIILENKTTAMTGHQEHAGTELDVLGNRSYIQDIEAIVRGMAGSSPLTVQKLSPADRDKYRKVLEETILRDGVKVVIADKECGITHNRQVLKEERKIVKKHGYLPRKTHMNVTPEVCENCLECTKQTACPGLTTAETDYGRKIDTDLTWCVNDGACERVRVSNDYGTNVKPCPSFEQVEVIRQRRRRYTLPHMGLDKLPEPKRVHPMKQPGDAWRAHMAGVGGMGIGVVNAILVRAGHKEGYHVVFADKKGLAIRNGGVYSQITFVKEEGSGFRVQGSGNREGEAPVRPNSPQAAEPNLSRPGAFGSAGASPSQVSANFTTGNIPYGKADLLFGVDILEAARATDAREQFRVASPDRTCAVLNTYRQPTVSALLGKQDFDPEILRSEIYDHCRPEHSFSQNLADICEQRLGSKLYVNIMMLGVAYQLGLIPVSGRSIAWAIKDSIRREHRKNLKAFNIGRKIALEPRALPRKPTPETWEQLVTNKSRIIRRTRMFGPALAMRFEKIVQGAMKQMRDVPESSKYDLALRIYDIMQYQNPAYAKRYVELVRGVYRRDNADKQYAATTAVIWNLAKVTLIKDEPYVSYLLTRFEKKQRDITKYGIDLSNGDRLVYRHHTNPEFNIGKRRIRFKITTRDWQLKLVSQCTWLRNLPGWHKREVAFRDWYIGLLTRVNLSTDYEKAVRILKSPEEVTGYREVRYPKQDRAREQVEADLGPVPPADKEPVSEIGSVLDALGTKGILQ